jgi:hypothetical protein
MLRSVLLLLSLGALGIGAFCLIIGADPPAFTFLIWGAILPGAGWERTSERFVDPDSGKTVTVYLQPGSGERQYVEE